jgi:hypoxanthine-DNA glycosylase
MKYLIHPFPPIVDKHSKVLILGSFPSIQSREVGFYYAHPQNRFWKLISYLTKTHPIPINITTKREMLLLNNIALWDIVQSCSIQGSNDNTIKDVIPIDLSLILNNSNIKSIFSNGDKAYKLCKKYSINSIKLPSTSSANASYSFEKLIDEWKVIIE